MLFELLIFARFRFVCLQRSYNEVTLGLLFYNPTIITQQYLSSLAKFGYNLPLFVLLSCSEQDFFFFMEHVPIVHLQ